MVRVDFLQESLEDFRRQAENLQHLETKSRQRRRSFYALFQQQQTHKAALAAVAGQEHTVSLRWLPRISEEHMEEIVITLTLDGIEQRLADTLEEMQVSYQSLRMQADEQKQRKMKVEKVRESRAKAAKRKSELSGSKRSLASGEGEAAGEAAMEEGGSSSPTEAETEEADATAGEDEEDADDFYHGLIDDETRTTLLRLMEGSGSATTGNVLLPWNRDSVGDGEGLRKNMLFYRDEPHESSALHRGSTNGASLHGHSQHTTQHTAGGAGHTSASKNLSEPIPVALLADLALLKHANESLARDVLDDILPVIKQPNETGLAARMLMEHYMLLVKIHLDREENREDRDHHKHKYETELAAKEAAMEKFSRDELEQQNVFQTEIVDALEKLYQEKDRSDRELASLMELLKQTEGDLRLVVEDSVEGLVKKNYEVESFQVSMYKNRAELLESDVTRHLKDAHENMRQQTDKIQKHSDRLRAFAERMNADKEELAEEVKAEMRASLVRNREDFVDSLHEHGKGMDRIEEEMRRSLTAHKDEVRASLAGHHDALLDRLSARSGSGSVRMDNNDFSDLMDRFDRLEDALEEVLERGGGGGGGKTKGVEKPRLVERERERDGGGTAGALAPTVSEAQRYVAGGVQGGGDDARERSAGAPGIFSQAAAEAAAMPFSPSTPEESRTSAAQSVTRLDPEVVPLPPLASQTAETYAGQLLASSASAPAGSGEIRPSAAPAEVVAGAVAKTYVANLLERSASATREDRVETAADEHDQYVTGVLADSAAIVEQYQREKQRESAAMGARAGSNTSDRISGASEPNVFVAESEPTSAGWHAGEASTLQLHRRRTRVSSAGSRGSRGSSRRSVARSLQDGDQTLPTVPEHPEHEHELRRDRPAPENLSRAQQELQAGHEEVHDLLLRARAAAAAWEQEQKQQLDDATRKKLKEDLLAASMAERAKMIGEQYGVLGVGGLLQSSGSSDGSGPGTPHTAPPTRSGSKKKKMLGRPQPVADYGARWSAMEGMLKAKNKLIVGAGGSRSGSKNIKK